MRSWPSLSSLPAGTTSTVATPHWAIAAPPKSNGTPHLVPSRPNEPLHRSGSTPIAIGPAVAVRNSNQVSTSGPSTQRWITSTCLVIANMPLSPLRVSATPWVLPRAPTKSTSVCSSGRTRWISLAFQASEYALATLCDELSVLIHSVCLVRTARLIGVDAHGTRERAVAHLGGRQ